MTPAKVVFHILQQGPSEGTLSFETLDRVIRNISKDINATTQKYWTQKRKEPLAKPKRTKLVLKLQGNKLWRKGLKLWRVLQVLKGEVSLTPLEEFYTMLEATPKNDQQIVRFAKAKWQVPNSTMSFSIFFPFWIHLLIRFLYFQVIWAFQDHKVWSFMYLKRRDTNKQKHKSFILDTWIF